ncbi:MAG: orotidine-5'-phosphate decarboxylase [Parvularculaceae bacterium]
MTNHARAAGRLIVALDVPSAEEARRHVELVRPAADFFKIGYQLAPVGGYDLARELGAAGLRVFLDLKLHDIGATVEKGVVSLLSVGADFLTVHAERDAVAAAVAGRGDDPRMKILAVTVLTSHDEASLATSGIRMPIRDLVLKRAEVAAEAGADGVVASPQEARAIRARCGDRLTIVTPGVRPVGAPRHDQARPATPAEAVANGADYLVVGRPITGVDDPLAAARSIAAEIAAPRG